MRIAMPAIPPVPPALAAHWSNIALFLLLSCSMLIKPSNFLAPLMLLAASVPAWRSWKRELAALPREFRWFCWAVCLLAISWLLDSLLSGQGLLDVLGAAYPACGLACCHITYPVPTR